MTSWRFELACPCLDLSSGLFPFGYFNSHSYFPNAFYITCPSIFLDFIILIILGEEYEL
jgi:hypothetical protein